MIKIRLKDISRVIKRRFLLRQIVSIIKYMYTDKIIGFIINFSNYMIIQINFLGLMQIILCSKACIPNYETVTY